MGLTTEKKAILRAQYARWGVDAVRKELGRNAWLVPPEIAAFARAWIASEEERRQRHARRIDLLRASAIGLLAGALMARVIQIGFLPHS